MIVMVSVTYEKYSVHYSSYRFIVMQASLNCIHYNSHVVDEESRFIT